MTSCLGLGLIPFAPGTFGSLPPVVIYMVLGYLYPCPLFCRIFMFSAVIVSSVICVKLTPKVGQMLGKEDPGEVVIDELAGQSLVFAIIGMVSGPDVCLTSAFGFAVFRLFDIIKPWPVNKLEKLPAGWGVLADDLMAGIYAGVVVMIFQHLT